MTDQDRVLRGLVVLTNGEDRAEWLRVRRSSGKITATAAAAIAGSHPYYSIVDVWNEQTDPGWSPEDARTKWTAAQIDLGTEREPEIIAWANADPRTQGEFVPVSAVVHHPDVTWGACSPDGAKRWPDGALSLIECKTGQKDWEADGIPDHVWDQVQWQLDTTQTDELWLAYEQYRWEGKGADKTPVLVKTWLTLIVRDEPRIAYLRARVAEFQADIAAGIAPESDVDLRDVDPFDPDADEAARLDALMAERVGIVAQLAPLQARQAEIDADLKAAVKQYHGRRVHLIGGQLTAKLVRFTRKTTDVSDMPEAWRRAHLKYSDSERVVIEPTESE